MGVREAARQVNGITRRDALVGAAAVALVPMAPARARATPEELTGAIKDIVGTAVFNSGRVKLTVPELAENGNSVSLSVAVDSPMTAADYVKTIHVLSEKNPITVVARFHLGPRAGRAKVATNIRLATTQTVTAIAEMSDGSFWSGTANVVVTLAACIEGTIEKE
jgi:sulfur-oxidizing protein SoxY